MPITSPEGSDWTRARVHALATDGPVSVLAVGPGAPAWGRWFDGPGIARLTGIAVPLDERALDDAGLVPADYDEVIGGDARTVPWPKADVVVIGDVAAAHLGPDELQRLWSKAAAVAEHAVYLSLPLADNPSGWDHVTVLARFPGIGDWWLSDAVGVYERRTDVLQHA